VRINTAASSDSDATPIGAGTPASRSPTNSLGARLKQQNANIFVEPKSVKGVVSFWAELSVFNMCWLLIQF